MRKSTCLLPKVHHLAAFGFAAFTLALLVGSVRSSHAQESDGVVPASYQSGSFFNQKLGTALRFNYHTHGYGTQEDVISLGGMKVFGMDGATVFVDGQGTLSDDFGGGFNLGVGYRQLTTTGMSFDPQRILGVGFWTDGQSTASDNFFTQLGFSLESLGESFDLRLNGHFPLERTQTSDATLTSVGAPLFLGNNLFNATERVTVDTAHTVVDGEFAKRINDLEAWAFVGGYQLGGGGVDATGYRAGVRGYAVPDLALSLQVTDDDVYATNVMFGITWFIGRTNKCNGPCGTIMDRFRQPVLRNDFIALTSRQMDRASGSALTLDGTNLVDIVHVDSTAATGGDGTFENPFDELADIDANGPTADNTRDGSIVLVHGGSMLDGSAELRQNVRLLGEGVDQDGSSVSHTVVTNGNVNVVLPETMDGALALNRPEIDGTGVAGAVLTMADGTAIDNFTINDAATAILADGVTVPTGDTVANVEINRPTTAGISLTNVMGSAVIDSNVIINGASGTGLLVSGGNESVTMNGSINDTTGRSLEVSDRTGGTFQFAGTINDDTANSDASTSTGVLIENNMDSVVSFDLASTLEIEVDGGAGVTGFDVQGNMGTTVSVSGAADVTARGDSRAVRFEGNDAASAVTLSDLDARALNGDTVSVAGEGTVAISSATATPARGIFNTGTGNAFFNDGATGSAIITVNSNVENSGGGNAVRILNRAEANDVQFTGTVNAMGAAGVFAQNNTDGTILFTNTLTLDTAGNNAVELVNNTGATLSFSDLDIDTTDGAGFIATGGGTLLVTSTNGTNDINVTGMGVGVNLTDMTIDAANVTFDVVGVGNGAGVGINLQNLDGTGQVIIGGGTNAGDGGSLTTAGTAINVNNANNVAFTNMTVSNAGAAQGVNVTGQQTGSSATFTGLDVNTADADAISVNNNDDGTVTFNTLTAMSSGTGDGIDLNNADGSTVEITINDATVNATGTGRGFAATGGGTNVLGGTNTIDSVGGTAFVADNVESLTASNVTINNTTQRGVVVTGQDTATDSVTLTNFDVTTTTADAVRVATNTDGTVNLNTLTAQSSDGGTVVIDDNGAGTVNINGMDATATGSGTAFSATGGGTLSAAGTNNVSANTGQGVDIDSMTIAAGGAAFANVDVTAGTTTGVDLTNNTGGPIVVNGGTMTTTGAAVNIAATESAAINGVTINNGTTNGAGIVANVAAGDTLSLSNTAVASGTSTGVEVAGAGTFTATGTNTIETTTGTGLDIDGTTIGAGGANFSTVDVNGATNGVVLNNLTGGQVTVGNGTTASTMTTIGDAITVTNAADVNINNIDVNTGGAGRGLVATNSNGNAYDLSVNDLTVNNATESMVASHTGAGNFTVAVTNSNFDDEVDVSVDGTGDVDFTFDGTLVDLTGDDVTAFTFDIGNAVTTANIQIDNSEFRSNDAVAFDLDSNTVGVKNITLQLTNSTSTNNSASAAVEIDAFGPTIMNVTVNDNVFNNTGAGDNFDMAANDVTTVINLDMNRNATNGGTDSVVLRELNVADFNIVDGVNVEANNPSVGNFIYDSVGNVNADFDDIPNLP